jgi:hypothetical protein
VTVGSSEADPGAAESDDHINLDYSSPDAARALQVDADCIIPTCNDASYRFAVELSRFSGLTTADSIGQSCYFLDKGRFRDLRMVLPIKMPEHYVCTSPEAALQVLEANKADEDSWLLKPVDSHTGRGITQISSQVDLEVAIGGLANISRNRQWVLERFISGQLFSVSCFLRDGAIEQSFFVDEFCVSYQFAVDQSNHPSRLPAHVREMALGQVAALVGYLELESGLIHTQFLANNAEVWAVESMRRCPGDFFGDLVETSTGFPYYEAYVSGFLGSQRSPSCGRSSVIPTQRMTLSAASPGTFRRIEVPGNAHTTMVYPVIGTGTKTAPMPWGKVAIVLTTFASTEELWRVTPSLSTGVESHSFATSEGLMCFDSE